MPLTVKSRKMIIFGHFQQGYRMLNFSIREVIFHNLLTLMLQNSLLQEIRRKWKINFCEIHILGCPPLNWGHHFGTSGGNFELKLGKHVHFVIFSIFSDFGEILKN